MIDDPATRKLRQADLWTGLGLAAFALGMLGLTSTFPITDSYGGVRNVWYVSPALLPLLIGCGILVLAALLVARAARDLGSDGVRRALRLQRAGIGPRTLRLLLILAAVSAYVFVFVPTVDFALATVFFLAVFIFGFHLDREPSVARNLVILATVTAVVGLAGVLTDPAVRDPVVDALTVGGVVLAAVINARALAQRGLPLKPWRQALIFAVLIPAILCPVFKYGLLVPLPHEGTVIEAMDDLRYRLFR
jgi:hypothetical protein